MIKKIIKLLSIICLLLTLIFMLLLLYIGITKVLEKNIPSYERKLNIYTIIGKSMEPTLFENDIIIIKKQSNYKLNDIITFTYTDENYNNIIITHRIINLKEENNKIFFITQGDNNKFKDNILIENNKVTGKLILKLPKFGYIKDFILNNLVIFLITFISLFIIVLVDTIKTIKQNKKKREQVFEWKINIKNS